MGAEYLDGDQHTHRSVLDGDENYVKKEAEADEPMGTQFHKQDGEPVRG